MSVAAAVMFQGNYHNVRGDCRNVPWNYRNVPDFCRFVPGNSPGLGIGYRDCFLFSMSSSGPAPQFSGKKSAVFAVSGVRSAPLGVFRSPCSGQRSAAERGEPAIRLNTLSLYEDVITWNAMRGILG